MKLWKLADFYRLEDLRLLATQGRDDAALHWANTYACHLQNPTYPKFAPKMLESIVQSITALYGDERKDPGFRGAFRPQLLGTAFCGISLLSRDEGFLGLIRDDPDFSAD